MPPALTLTDGTTTLDLVGSTYKARAGMVDWGRPAPLRAEHGNIFRSAWGITGHARGRRSVQVPMRVNSGSLSAFTTALQDLQDALERARAWAQWQLGNRWYLSWQPGDGKTYQLTVRDGFFVMPPEERDAVRLNSTAPWLARGMLELDCDPFWRGAAETVENYVADPSFEVAGTALNDWVDFTIGAGITGTRTRDTTQKKYGNASLKVAVTDIGTAGGNEYGKAQSVTSGGSQAWTLSIWYHVTAMSGTRLAARAQSLDGADGFLANHGDANVTATTSAFTQYKVSFTSHASAAKVRILLTVLYVSNNGTCTAYFDGISLTKTASAPTAFVSGRDIRSHYDDDGQAHLNYVDVFPEAGDVPAMVQVKATETQVHTKVWAGARHASRQNDGSLWHEGEDFGTWESEPSDAAASDSIYGEYAAEPLFDAASSASVSTPAASSLTFSHTVTATRGRRLVVVGVNWVGAETVSTVTYAGTALTRLGGAANTTTKSDIWYLKAPATGANNVVVTLSAAQTEWAAGAVSVTGVDQTTPLGSIATATGSDLNTMTLAVTTIARDLVIDSLCVNNNFTLSATVGAGQTQRWNVVLNTDQRLGLGSTEIATTTSTTMSWSPVWGSGSGTWASAGVGIRGSAGTAAAPIVVTKAVTSPPRGLYRVLARVSNPDAAAWGVAMGWAYGGVTTDPAVAGDYATIAAATTAFHWLEIGTLTVPPDLLPDGATIGTLTLRLAFYRTTAASGGDRFRCDAVMLLPVDFGSAYASKTSATDVVVLDTISPEVALTLWNASDVYQSRPQQEGKAIYVDPDGSRVYVLFDNGSGAPITDGATVAVRIIPQYEQVA